MENCQTPFMDKSVPIWLLNNPVFIEQLKKEKELKKQLKEKEEKELKERELKEQEL